MFLGRLTGTQAQMGAQHGRLVARDAVRLLALYRTMPERTLAGDLGALGKLAVRAIATAWQARLTRDRPADFAARTRAFLPLARRWRAELAALHGDGLDELNAQVRRRHRGTPHANLMMMDAY